MLQHRIASYQVPVRRGYEESCRRLWNVFLDHGFVPPMPQSRPHPDDNTDLGLSFFRTFVGQNDDLSNLTLPRTFFAETEIRNASFANSDFRESNFCYNDLIAVDFSIAILKNSDLRCSLFSRVNFTNADLSFADLRHSKFDNCNFTDTVMDGTILTRSQGMRLELSKAQRAVISWRWTAGKLAPGG